MSTLDDPTFNVTPKKICCPDSCITPRPNKDQKISESIPQETPRPPTPAVDAVSPSDCEPFGLLAEVEAPLLIHQNLSELDEVHYDEFDNRDTGLGAQPLGADLTQGSVHSLPPAVRNVLTLARDEGDIDSAMVRLDLGQLWEAALLVEHSFGRNKFIREWRQKVPTLVADRGDSFEKWQLENWLNVETRLQGRRELNRPPPYNWGAHIGGLRRQEKEPRLPASEWPCRWAQINVMGGTGYGVACQRSSFAMVARLPEDPDPVALLTQRRPEGVSAGLQSSASAARVDNFAKEPERHDSVAVWSGFSVACGCHTFPMLDLNQTFLSRVKALKTAALVNDPEERSNLAEEMSLLQGLRRKLLLDPRTRVEIEELRAGIYCGAHESVSSSSNSQMYKVPEKLEAGNLSPEAANSSDTIMARFVALDIIKEFDRRISAINDNIVSLGPHGCSEDALEAQIDGLAQLQGVRRLMLADPKFREVLRTLAPEQERAAQGDTPLQTGQLESQRCLLGALEHRIFAAREQSICDERNRPRDYYTSPPSFFRVRRPGFEACITFEKTQTEGIERASNKVLLSTPDREGSGINIGSTGGKSSSNVNSIDSESEAVSAGPIADTAGNATGDTRGSPRSQRYAADPGKGEEKARVVETSSLSWSAPSSSSLNPSSECHEPLEAMDQEHEKARTTLQNIGWEVLAISTSHTDLYTARLVLQLTADSPSPRKDAIREGAVALLDLGWKICKTKASKDSSSRVTLDLLWSGSKPRMSMGSRPDAGIGAYPEPLIPSLQGDDIRATTSSLPPLLSLDECWDDNEGPVYQEKGEDSVEDDDDTDSLPSVEELQRSLDPFKELVLSPRKVLETATGHRKRSGTIVPSERKGLSGSSDTEPENQSPEAVGAVPERTSSGDDVVANRNPEEKTSCVMGPDPASADSVTMVSPGADLNVMGERFSNPLAKNRRFSDLARKGQSLPLSWTSGDFNISTGSTEALSSLQQEEIRGIEPLKTSGPAHFTAPEPRLTRVECSAPSPVILSKSLSDVKVRQAPQPDSEVVASQCLNHDCHVDEQSAATPDLPETQIDDEAPPNVPCNAPAVTPRLNTANHILLSNIEPLTSSPTSSISISTSERKRRSLAFNLDGVAQG